MSRLYLADEAATRAAARHWAERLQPGDCLTLAGDLGAGKSVFARALMRGLGVRDHALPSPSYSLIEVYQAGEVCVAHMDWYRLSDEEEVLMLGVMDYFSPPWISIIEWPERAEALLPRQAIRLLLQHDHQHPQARWLEEITS